MKRISYLFNSTSLLYLCVFASLGLGLYYRVVGLGLWSLAADEYYIARSIQNIFSYGLPKFEYGGFYTRGLIYQYLSAPFVFFTSPELGLRIVSVGANIATIFISFLLAKKILNIRAALIVVILLALSVWEIEFSRFGRMYSLYQTFFMVSLYFMYEYYTEEKQHTKYLILLFATLGAFTWEGGLFLFPLAIAVTFLKNKIILDKDFLWYLLPMLLVVAFSSVDFRLLGDVPHFEISITPETKTSIPTKLLMANLLDDNRLLGLYAFIMLFNFFAIKRLLKVNYPLYGKFLFGLSFVCLFMGFIGLSFSILIIMGLIWKPGRKLGVGKNSNNFTPSKLMMLFYAINLSFWCLFVYVVLIPEYHDVKSLLKSFESLIGFPNIYRNLVVPWARVFPITAIILISAGFITYYKYLTSNTDKDKGMRFILYVLFLSIMLVGVTKLPYSITRYSYFFYPLFIINFVIALTYLSGMISWLKSGKSEIYLILSAISIYILVSEDYLFTHLNKIESYDANFRVNYRQSVEEHYYPRYDYRGAAEILNKNAASDDILITTEEATAFYLERANYYFKSTNNRTYPLVATNRGAFERWSTLTLISQISELEKLIHTSLKANKHVWLILNRKKLEWLEEQRKFSEKYSHASKYLTRDGVFAIYYF